MTYENAINAISGYDQQGSVEHLASYNGPKRDAKHNETSWTAVWWKSQNSNSTRIYDNREIFTS